MKRVLALCWMLSLLIPQQGQGQNGDFFTGGTIGASFGNKTTMVDISPLAGYRFNSGLAVGATATYKYYRLKDYYIYNSIPPQYYDLVGRYIGGGLFQRYYFNSNAFGFLNNTFVHAEWEVLQFNFYDYSLKDDYTGLSKHKRVEYIHNVLIGGGYSQTLGGYNALNIMILYNLTDSEHSPYYSNPMIKVGFDIQL